MKEPKEQEKNLVDTNSIDEPTSERAVAVKEENAVAVRPKSYITGLLYEIKEDFIAVNEGLDLDFVYIADRLKIDKKGNFLEADDESMKFGDKLDVIIGAGEKLFSLWGKKETPYDGQLIVADADKEQAIAKFTEWLAENPEAQEEYKVEDIKLRYITYFISVDSIIEAAKDGGLPTVYLMTFAPTVTITFGKYTHKIYQGKFKANGVKPRTPVNQVVTRMSTVDKKGQGNDSYIAIEFEAIGMFDPEEYGISVEETVAE